MADLDGRDLQPEVRSQHLLLLVRLEPVQGLLGKQMAEEAEGLALGGQPGLGPEGGALLRCGGKSSGPLSGLPGSPSLHQGPHSLRFAEEMLNSSVFPP